MNKSELISQIAEMTQLTKTQSEEALDAAFRIIQNQVSSGGEVKIVGFGTFDRLERQARSGRNPKTGQPIKIPGSQVPRFRPGKEFRNKVNA